MKKEELNYYDEFEKNVDYALQISNILKEYINDFEYDKSLEKENRVHGIENEADANLHKILNYLIKDFLPPFDREDIIELTHKIDDVVDSIDEVVINIDIVDIKKPSDDMKDMVNLLNDACVKLKDMMQKFRHSKKYQETLKLVVEINGIEGEGDILYQEAMKKLFKTEKDPIELSKWRVIYNCLEDCFDSCEYVANCVEEIIMKNS